MARNEEGEQIALCDYIKLQYPNVVFTSDHSGLRVTKGLQQKIKRLKSANGIPDLLILEARGGYCGLLIEMKATGVTVFRKNGMLRNDEHLRTQYKMLMELSGKGYFSGFCEGFDKAKEVVDWYMGLAQND